jgi:Pvc16 N-terminal domain
VIKEADDVLRALLESSLGKRTTLSFEPPAAAREAVPKTNALLNVHLVAIEEQRDLSAAGFSHATGPNGTLVRTEPPRYIRLTYWVSAWGHDAASEHELLGQVLQKMAGIDHIPPALLSPGLQARGLPVQVSVAAGQSVGQRVADVWSSLGEPMKAGIELTLLVPIDVGEPADTAALVVERRLRMTGPPPPPVPAVQAPPGIPNALMPTPAPAVPTAAPAAAAPAAAPAATAAGAQQPSAGGGEETDAGPTAPAVVEELTYGPDPHQPPTPGGSTSST